MVVCPLAAFARYTLALAVLCIPAMASAETTAIPLPKPRPADAVASTSEPEVEAVEAEKPTDELFCLTEAIYFEARGENERGQFAVGRVILNRVESRSYPDSICEVVYQNAERLNACQFSFVCDGDSNPVTEPVKWKEALSRAQALIACEDRCHHDDPHRTLWASTHYHADYVNPDWAAKLVRTAQVGQHIFYLDETVQVAMQ